MLSKLVHVKIVVIPFKFARLILVSNKLFFKGVRDVPILHHRWVKTIRNESHTEQYDDPLSNSDLFSPSF